MKLMQRQIGMTLVEVMISLSMGVVFLTAAMSFLISGQQSYRSQDTGTRIQENARFAMDILKENVRLSGYSENSLIAPGYVFRDACGTTLNGQSSAICSADTTTVQGDRIAIPMVSRDAEDCLGTDLGSDTYVANVFWVQRDTGTGVSSLYCNGYDIENEAWHTVGGQPLVDGIDQMQVQYGVFNAATNSVDRYLNAAGVELLTNGWENVRSVRIALLVSSGFSSNEGANSGADIDSATFDASYDTFTLLDGAEYDPGDNAIRRVFASTITINNSL